MRTVVTLVLSFALLASTAVMAQEKQKKKGKRPALSRTSQILLRMERLREASESLDLTAAQREKLAQLREEFSPAMKETWQKIQDILTEEQRNAATEAARTARDAGKQGRAFFAAVEASFKLTDEQKEKMVEVEKALMRLQRKTMKGVRGVLTAEQQEQLKQKMNPAAKKAGKKAGKKAAKKKQD